MVDGPSKVFSHHLYDVGALGSLLGSGHDLPLG
jgi:hypothetical protein